MKKCKDCQKTPEETPFPKHPGYKDGLGNRCKACKSAWQREHYKKTRGAEHQRRKHRDPDYIRKKDLRRFGLTIEDYERMFEDQGGLCRICKKPPTESRRLAVDHCHDSNIVRGLLCGNCNLGLGHFYDNSELLNRAIEYLRTCGVIR